MDALVAYSLPIQGLKTGMHHFKFEVDRAFFTHFEGSPVEDGNIVFQLELDRRPDMMLLDFSLSGTVRAECDRCTALIDLPVQDERQLIVKFGDAEGELEDEVVFIQREAPEFNVAKYLYEFVVLSLPFTNTYDCQSEPNPPCNQDVLKRLASDENDGDSRSVWDSLKDLKNDN